jgi:hypothetical protein
VATEWPLLTVYQELICKTITVDYPGITFKHDPIIWRKDNDKDGYFLQQGIQRRGAARSVDKSQYFDFDLILIRARCILTFVLMKSAWTQTNEQQAIAGLTRKNQKQEHPIVLCLRSTSSREKQPPSSEMEEEFRSINRSYQETTKLQARIADELIFTSVLRVSFVS